MKGEWLLCNKQQEGGDDFDDGHVKDVAIIDDIGIFLANGGIGYKNDGGL
jgi:hypothetical protein